MKKKIDSVIIEKLNKEYLELYLSKEYRSGRRIAKIKNALKHFDIKTIIKFIKSYLIQIRLSRFNYNKKQTLYFNRGEENDKKGVIYSCITNNYDNLQEPLYYEENCDYVLFCDKQMPEISQNWTVNTVDISSFSDGIDANRFYKMNHHLLFEDKYDYSIYIDGNVRLISDVSPLYTLAKKSPIGIAMHRHSQRFDLYDEANYCILAKRGNKNKIKDQISKYKTEGFPKHYGLCEATVIVVDLHNDIAKKIMKMWWEEYSLSESKRDQLSFPYVLWKSGYNISDVGDLGNNILFNPKIQITNIGEHSFK